MTAAGVVFLMYHELESAGCTLCRQDPGYLRYVLRDSDFRAQMAQLKSDGRSGIGVGEAIGSFPARSVVITFDDGSESDLLAAAPILREFGFGATFYITSGWLGGTAHLGSSQLRELSSLGFEIGSHSATHPDLTSLDAAGLRREILDSKIQIEQIIGKPVEHFSCPGGRFNARVAQTARDAGYRTVSTSQPRLNTPATDRFALGRVPMLRHTSLSEFQNICHGRGQLRARLGVGLREAARSLLGNSLYDRMRENLLRRRSETGNKG